MDHNNNHYTKVLSLVTIPGIPHFGFLTLNHGSFYSCFLCHMYEKILSGFYPFCLSCGTNNLTSPSLAAGRPQHQQLRDMFRVLFFIQLYRAHEIAQNLRA